MNLPRRTTAPDHAVFHFDFADPYAFLAARRIPPLLESRGTSLALAPVYARKLAPPGDVPAEGLSEGIRGYVIDDVARIARRLGLTFAGPAEFPFDSRKLLGLCLFVRERSGQEAMAAVADALWHEFWERGADPRDEGALLRAVGDVAIPEATLRAALADPALAARVERETIRARERGVTAVPAVDDGTRVLAGFQAVAALDPDLARAAGIADEKSNAPEGGPRRGDMPDWTFTG